MLLRHLILSDFRNYKGANLDFFDGINIIFGENGAGKTNILEAIYYLALTKSFRTNYDRHLVLNKSSMFRIQGEFEVTPGRVINSSIAYSPSQQKRLVVNGQKISKFSDYIGEIPVVLLSPSDLQLSQGSPYLRRRFIDILLCQSHKVYLHHLLQYNRSLKQRNQLLQSKNFDPKLLDSWTDNLISNGEEIIKKRQNAVTYLNDLVKKYYLSLSASEDNVKIIYQSTINLESGKEISTSFCEKLSEKRSRELDFGNTIIGPHRDDLLFLINGKPLKIYASQGEHKTGELDAIRIEQMLSELGNFGQVFGTTTSRNFFEKLNKAEKPIQFYYVKNGDVRNEAA
jgi:DNA replication and repair protein RecF